MMIILLVALILMLVSLTAYSPENQPVKQKTAEVILNERYAKGEISHQEYQGKKQQLNH
jgi:uncharacterized membrane protein